MWLSATCFFYTYHRVYCPAYFARRYDRSGRYVRHWLPALRRLPDEFVYEPWKAPPEVQRAVGCVVGRDYPAPMCDPEAAAQANLRRMDACYAAAPDAWRRLIPLAAAAEVARERGVNIKSAARVPQFAPTRVAPPQPAPVSASAAAASTSACAAPVGLPTGTAPAARGRAGGGSGRARGAGRARARGPRIQHGLY
jgi:hypothetical protein